MIAKNWSQVTPHQAVLIATLRNEGKTTHTLMKIYEALLPESALLDYAQLTAKKIFPLLKGAEWVFDTPILEPHLDSFIINDVRYCLPDATFKNVHLIEFSYATDFFNVMVEQKSYNALNKIIASLCRPEKKNIDVFSPDYDGDKRERFNPELIDYYASLIEYLPFEFKCYFLAYFNSCADHIVNTFKPLFTQGITDDSGYKSITPNFGWLGVIMSLSDAQVFGNFTQTQYTNIYTALAYRLKKYFDEKDLK